jgi:hypothetical protein
MVNATLPSTWIVMWSQWIVWRKSWVTTFEISAATGNAYFKWEISAESGYINWELIMWSWGSIKSSNYTWSNWWLLNTSWLYMWIDSEIFMRPWSWIYVWYGWSWPKLELLWNKVAFLDSNTAEENWLYATYEWDLVLWSANFTPNNNLSQNLWDPNYSWNRVYSSYYNFRGTGAYFTIWWTTWNHIPIFYNWTTNYTSLFVYQTSTAMATPNRKLRVNVNWIEYWLYAERI